MPHMVFDLNASRFLRLSGCGMKLTKAPVGSVPHYSVPFHASGCMGESPSTISVLRWENVLVPIVHQFAAKPRLDDTAASSLFAFSDHAFCRAVNLGNARGGCGTAPSALPCCADQFVRIVAVKGLYLFLRPSPLLECFDGAVKRPCCGWVTVQPIGPPIVQHEGRVSTLEFGILFRIKATLSDEMVSGALSSEFRSPFAHVDRTLPALLTPLSLAP